MITLEVKLDKLKKDYPKFFNFFNETLRNSNSRYNDYKEEKFKCYYYIGFYMFPSQKTTEYYTNLYEMEWNNRLEEELSKTRVTITMVAGKFALSDQVKEIPDGIMDNIKDIVARKMYMEQLQLNGEEDNEIINSIPDIKNLKEKIQEEIKSQKEIMDKIADGDLSGIISTKKEKEKSPNERLKELIENEDYEKAEELIKKHPELRKRDE